MSKFLKALAILLISMMATACLQSQKRDVGGGLLDQPPGGNPDPVVAMASCKAATSGGAGIGNAYYVSSLIGSPGNDGLSPMAPFATIQMAASAAHAGDVVMVGTGVYRETVIPNSGSSGKPIVFAACPGQSPVLSGADIVSSPGDAARWTIESGKIWAAKVSNAFADRGNGSNQVFVDGQMVLEARWPAPQNADPSYPAPTRSSIDSVSSGVITDSQLAGLAVNGATIHITPGGAWHQIDGTVSQSATQQSANSFTYVTDFGYDGGGTLIPAHKNLYFLTGQKSFLASAGQWFFDSSSKNLSLWTAKGDNPSLHLVELKNRSWGFDLSGKAYITIQGLGFFASAINTSSTSHDISINQINASYLSHFTSCPPGVSGQNESNCDHNTGIVLAAYNSIVKNSVLRYSAGGAISLTGHDNLIDGNTISDVAYSPHDGAAIYVVGTNDKITNNKMTRSGRHMIRLQYATSTPLNVIIKNNELSLGGLQTNDFGLIYSSNTIMGTSEIAYNYIHDAVGIGLQGPGSGYVVNAGIYFDSDSQSSTLLKIHDNTVWNAENPLFLHNQDANIEAYNNNLFSTNLYSGSGAMSIFMCPVSDGTDKFTGDSTGISVHDNTVFGSVSCSGQCSANGNSQTGNSAVSSAVVTQTIADLAPVASLGH